MKRSFLASISLFVLPAFAPAAEIDFESEIRPILAEKCLLCHGPDDKKGGLRLTGIEFASQELKSGETAIVPGDVETSHLLDRIHATDPDDVMPPPDKAEPLTDVEKAKLKRWIAEGANWPKHWAYDELRTSNFERPTSNAGNHPIDELVQKRLREELSKFDFQSSMFDVRLADPVTLARRLHYDLIGLPPTPERVDAFVAEHDKSGDAAIETLVDELLASPRFGERWGRHWLDIARYADSDGYEKDNGRPNAWRYRDWVIDAINADMPYDQFTLEQFAGDLLEKRTEPQLLATAFNRQTLTNTEGGTDKEQWRVAAVMDRVETMGAAWLGLTVGCARCHTHKYDELTHTEYYQLFAYFNNGDETTSRIAHTPEALAKWEATRKKHAGEIAELKKKIVAADEKLKPRLPELEKRTRELLAEAKDSPEPKFAPLVLKEFSGPKGVKFNHNKSDNTVLISGEDAKQGTYTVIGEIPANTRVTAIKLEVLPDKSFPKNGPGRSSGGNFVLNHFKISITGKPQFFGDAEADFSQKEWHVSEALDGNITLGKEGSGWAVSGAIGKPHHAIFGLVEPVEFDKPTKFSIQMIQHYGENHMIGKFRLSVQTTPTHLAAPKELRDLLSKQQGPINDPTLLTRFYQNWDSERTGLVRQLNSVESKIPEKPAMNVRVLTERTNSRRSTHIFERGEFKRVLDEVKPGTPSVFPPVKHRDGSPGDRLDLARWLVSGENPLPPRVAVNHVWKHLFGAGLVGTVNDFGVRGDRPTHPELLDWLAVEFIKNGWSRKKLIKTIVMSETYRQISDHRPELVEIDPKNRLLARQNRFRVEAEIVRDISLEAAGLLSDKIGGPSVFPPIPPGVTDQNYNSAFKWTLSKGEDRYRRGMYTYFKRTAPHPNLMTFDCPDSNVTCVERTRSNTPLAALITLNNETFTEAARALANRVLTEKPEADEAAKIDHVFRICLSRVPEDVERERLASLLAEARSFYRENAEDAKKFAGEELPEGISVEEAASWAATVRVVLNLEEFLVRS
ncbi:MAG: DUF1553 domain-containing protein [Verrucomicrobiales bacterium]|nr:DUF1553 domain-containing protein [Verrucomicrobiales bacterium]